MPRRKTEPEVLAPLLGVANVSTFEIDYEENSEGEACAYMAEHAPNDAIHGEYVRTEDYKALEAAWRALGGK